MRSFSNIMPNFADKLHLLVDSIEWLGGLNNICKKLVSFKFLLYLCTR